MVERAAKRLRPVAASQPELTDIAAYCVRPACGKEYRRAIQPGRRQVYCCPECRRMAEQEIRQLRSRLRDLESSVDQQRRLLAAYNPDEPEIEHVERTRSDAQQAIARAAGVVRFMAASDDPIADEYRALYGALAPYFANP